MTKPRPLRLVVLSVVVVVGCGSAQRPQGGTTAQGGTNDVTAPTTACVGQIEVPDQLQPVDDPALLTSALGDPGKGELCTGRVYRVETPVTVYRVWTAAKSYTLYGRWWSFDAPVGPREAYREANAICPEWSPLDVASSCRIKAGTLVVVGPGQSADCDGGVRYPRSPVNQVYIPNDSRNNQVFVENCTDGEPWPAP